MGKTGVFHQKTGIFAFLGGFLGPYPAIWTGKRDSGVLEPGLGRTGVLLWAKTTHKTMHCVVFCDHSGVLASVRGVAIDLVSFSLINHTS